MAELYVATGDGFARVKDHAGVWEVTRALTGGGVQCLAVDPFQPGTVYVGSHGNGVWKSTDRGALWQDMHLPQPDVFSLAVSPADGAVYAGTEPSRLFRSADGGQTWRELAAMRQIPSSPTWSFPPRPWTSHVRWIAPNPFDAKNLLVGIELGGLMYTIDGGETWLDHRPGAQRDVHALAWHPRAKGRAYEAGGGGAAWSRDGGLSWVHADAGRDRHYTWALALDPDDPDCWFISASTGPMQAHGSGNAQAHLYRWRSHGPWEKLGGGLPGPIKSMPYALASARGQVYAGLANGTIYMSRDRGDTWELLKLSGDPISGVVAMACVE